MKDTRQLLIEHPIGNTTIIKNHTQSVKSVNEAYDLSSQFLPEGIADDAILIRGPVQRADVENKNGRIYPRPILEREVQRLNNIIKEVGGILGELDHPECYLHDYQVLTEEGGKFHSKVSDSDKLLTLNIKTNTIETQPITKRIEQPYNGYGYHIKGRNIDSVVTPNHRLLLVDRHGNYYYETIENIYNNRKAHNHSYIPKHGKGLGKEVTDIVLPNVNISSYVSRYKEDLIINIDGFVKFLGIWLADGGVSKNSNQIGITQTKKESTQVIRSLFESAPDSIRGTEYSNNSGKNTKTIFSICDARLANYLKKLGNCYTKHVPGEIKQLSPQLLEELVYGFNLGDGRIQKHKHGIRKNVFSVSRQLMEDIHECIIKSEGSCNGTIEYPNKDYIFADHLILAENKSPLYQLNLSTSNGIYMDERFLSIEKTFDHDCVARSFSVPNSNYYVLQNGKAYGTGNSTTVSLGRTPTCIRKLGGEDSTLMAIAEILDPKYNPNAGIAYSIAKAGLPLGISSRGLGSLSYSNGANIVQEDFEMVCWDLVSDPSTHSAYMRQVPIRTVKESVEEKKIVKEINKSQSIEDAIKRILF